MSFRKVISAIAAACVLTGSLALGTTDAFAAAPKAASHKEISCKSGLTAHQVKVGDKMVWKCGKPAAKKAPAKATTAKAKTKAHPKKATKKTSKKLTCKKGLVAHPVKVNGKTVWKCGKAAPKKPAAKHHAVKAPAKKASAKKAPAKKATAKKAPAKKATAKKAAPKKATKLTCKKGSTAKKVKKNGKWVYECFKVKPSAKK